MRETTIPLTRLAAVVCVLSVVPCARAAEVTKTAQGLVVPVEPTALSEVLDQISRQTGMKVVYEGPPPRQLVRVDLTNVKPVEAVLKVLEGVGLNYAIQMDARATRVETIVIVSNDFSAPRPQIARVTEPEPVIIEAPPEVPIKDAVEADAGQEVAPGIVYKPEVRYPSPGSAVQEIAPGIVYRPEAPVQVPTGPMEIAPGIVYRPEPPKEPAPSPQPH